MASLSRTVKQVAVAVDRVRPPAPGATILIYHRVGARTPVAVDLPTARFDEQVAELAASGRVRTLDQAVAGLTAPGSDRPDPVVLTFDDGTVDFLEEALPVLVRHQVPAVLYVATAFVEEQRSFPDDGLPISWAGLAEAVATGLVTIGSHTHGHLLLDRTELAEVEQDLDRSIELIGERLGVEADHFAYPKALLGSDGAQAVVRSRFRTAVIAGTRANRPGRADLHRLHRSPIQVGDEMRWFRAKAAGGLALEDGLRRVVNRVRYRGATT